MILLRNWRRVVTLAALAVLGLTSWAQAQPGQPGPQICPFYADFLSPTLLDVLFSPGATFRT
jgi:hypothetical protein